MKLIRRMLRCSSGLLVACLLSTLSASEATRYVWQESPTPALPYTNWLTAAHSLQEAVDAAQPGDTVLVTNGVYATGGKAMFGLMTNRVAIDKAVTVQSVAGPAVTVIAGAAAPGGGNGEGAIRCAYVATHAVLNGFTLTHGHTRSSYAADYYRERSGGGAWCEDSAQVTNCILTSNSAAAYGGGATGGTLDHCTLAGNSSSAGGGAWSNTLYRCTLTANSSSSGDGGGALSCTLYNCALFGNTSEDYGGGAHQSTLYHCTVSSNSAAWGGGTSGSILYDCLVNSNSVEMVGGGGGAFAGRLYNCTLTGNSARNGGGIWGSIVFNCIVYDNSELIPAGRSNYVGGEFYSSCTTPLPTNGTGNITNAPLFVDPEGGNLRLQSNSPCLNAGNNAYVTNRTDLDGRPRIVGEVVDMGACEFQPGVSGLFIGWLQQYGLPTDGSADTTDSDGDRLNNSQEWRCGTNPTNALSALRVLPPVPTGADLAVRWQSVSNRVYFLERSTNLAASPPFQPLATNLPGQAGTTTYTDTNATGTVPRFYRVGVE